MVAAIQPLVAAATRAAGVAWVPVATLRLRYAAGKLQGTAAVLTTSCCAPQPGCEHCQRSRRIRETFSDKGVRHIRYVHLAVGGGFVDCAIQSDGQPYDHHNKGAARG